MTDKEIFITLSFLKSTWIQIRDNEDKIIFSKLMNPSEEYSYSVNDNYYITTGNAGNIIVSIDGKVRGKIGKFGEVKESFFVGSEFNN